MVSLGISTRTVGLSGYVSYTDYSTAQERRAADATLAAESRRGNAALLDYCTRHPSRCSCVTWLSMNGVHAITSWQTFPR